MRISWLIGFALLSLSPSALSERDPFRDQQRGLAAINLPAGAKQPGNRVVVAVIDSGLDYVHPDLANERIWRNPNEVPNGRDDDRNGYTDDLIGWNFLDDSNNPWDFAGHGTHVAGIIAAQAGNGIGIDGVSANAVIMPLKVLNLGGYGSSELIAEAIFYAVHNGAQIINLSLGSQGISPIEQTALAYAERQGVLVVVAAGNRRVPIQGWGPADSETGFVVGALDAQGDAANFSNYGDVDVAAPGTDILSLRARRTDLALLSGSANPGEDFVGPQARLIRSSGTSFAAPFVSGVAALLLGRDETLSAPQLRRMLRSSARDAHTPGIDKLTGYGVVDAVSALAADPDAFIAAEITGVRVVRSASGPAVEVLGTADAGALQSYVVQIGQGSVPQTWQSPLDAGRERVIDGVLAAIPAQHFAGSPLWMVRLIVSDAKLNDRETRFELKLQ